jgi:uncharacterized pyridoxal phosphate-containing UPF0001 family protein
MSIRENLQKLRKTLPEDITLVAVSKTKPPELIMEAYEAGHRIFGENKVQELIAKQPELPDDIEWHFIGHMQTNKVKFLVPFIHMIHGVDSLKLLNKTAGYNACFSFILPRRKPNLDCPIRKRNKFFPN